jgi:hypothetical protein
MKRSAVINLAVVLLAVVAGGVMSLRPWRGYRDQRAETDRQIGQMKTYERERANLLREEARANSSIGHEERARALGYVRPGQRPASDP